MTRLRLSPFGFRQVGENNVHAALSLVGYEADLRKAMEYVFGSTLVCDTLDNAKRVAFDKQVMTKTVTLGGDVFDPQGTLSGGESEALKNASTVLWYVEMFSRCLERRWYFASAHRCNTTPFIPFFSSRRSLPVGIRPVQPTGIKGGS